MSCDKFNSCNSDTIERHSWLLFQASTLTAFISVWIALQFCQSCPISFDGMAFRSDQILQDGPRVAGVNACTCHRFLQVQDQSIKHVICTVN